MVSAFELLALIFPVALFTNGAVGVGVKYAQWKNYHVSEFIYTLIGVIFGIFGTASALACFHYEYGDVASRVILMVTGVHMMIRPLRHRKWAGILSILIGTGIFFGAIRYWTPQLVAIREWWLAYFNTKLFFDPLQMALLGGLCFGFLMYLPLKFAEDLLGTASNFLDHPFIAIPVGILALVEGIVTGIPPHHSIITYALVAIFGAGATQTATNTTGGLLNAT